jgi:lipopolysaccharide exporter
MAQPTPLPPTAPSEESPIPLEERLEERFQLRGRSLREHTARGAIINSAFQVGLAVIGLIRRVGVAAFLTTGDYGIWGILVTTLLTLSWLKQIGISDKFVQQDEPDQEAAFQKAFTLEVAYTLCFYVLVLAALPAYALIYDRSSILLPGFILSLAFLATALQTPIWIAFRRMQFVRQRTLESIDPVVSTAVTLTMAAMGFGFWSLVIGAIAGSFSAAAAALLTSQYKIRWRFDGSALREYFGFSWPLFVSGVSGLVVVQATMIVGNYTVGLAGLGVLALAHSFASFADRVDQVISRTIYPAICAVRHRTDLLFEVFVKSNRLAVMWGLSFGVGMLLFAPDFVNYVLGERWRPAIGVLQAIGLMIGVRQIAFNWTVFMRALNRTKPIAAWGAVSVASFAAITGPLMFWLGLDGFIIGMSVGVAINIALRGYFLAQVFTGFQISRHIVRSVLPNIPPLLLIFALRLVEPAERTPEIAIGELVIYLIASALVTWRFERDLLTEVAGYLRRRPRPAVSA